MIDKFRLMLLVAAAAVPVPALAASLLDPGLAGQTIFSGTYTTTGANSSTFGNVLDGGVSTTGASSAVFGDLVSVGAATTGGAGSTVSGNIVSGGAASIGDGSLIGGDVTASGASTIGANSHIAGNMISGGAVNTGANSFVGGSILSGGAASTGGNSTVVGAVGAIGAITVGANGMIGSSQALVAQPIAATAATAALVATVSTAATSVSNARSALDKLGAGTVLAATLTTDQTLFSGVYSAASLSTTAGTTLTLDGQGLADQFWVFNIADILATGASTTIALKDFGANSSVIWNTGGYASLGADSSFVGTILAKDYISVGANTVASGVGSSCGGLYSATSYVSTGDSAHIGSHGCTGANAAFDIDASGTAVYRTTPALPSDGAGAVPEPGTWALMLTGLGMIGWSLRRTDLRKFVTAS